MDRLKTYLPHLGIIALFVAISFLYFGAVMEGKELPQMDNTHAKGMMKELSDYKVSHPDEQPMWSSTMFSGMPSYQIHLGNTNNIFLQLKRAISLSLPDTTVAILFLYMLCGYVLFQAFKIDKWVSFAGAITFGFASYNLIIIVAGHIAKCYAIAFMPPVIAGVILVYHGRYVSGGLLTLVALGMQISTNHIQITYYLLLIMAVMAIGKFIYDIKHKQLKRFVRASIVVGVASVLAVLPNFVLLFTTYEYGKETIRGKQILTEENAPKQDSGLDKGYALAWSYGIPETWSLLVPNIVGGGTQQLGNNKAALENVDDQLKQTIAGQNHYWGDKPFTSGPVYVGAIVFFLFVLGMFMLKHPIKWWLFATVVLSILLAWGKNFMFFTDIVFNYLPFYNKFRTVEMAMVIAGVAIPILAILALHKIVTDPHQLKKEPRSFYWAFGLTGGIALAFYLMPAAFFSFITDQENNMLLGQRTQNPQYASQIDAFIRNLEIARTTILKADAIRSFFFIICGAAAVFVFAFTNKIKKEYFALLMAGLFLLDMWVIDRRYLNNEMFVSKRKAKSEFVASAADIEILKDKDLNYRVLNIATDPFREVNTSYFHKSLGGYHGAKLRRYQDVIDRYLSPATRALQTVLQKGADQESVKAFLAQDQAMNMLNARYIIANPNAAPIKNPYALGNAWFVNNVQLVNTPNEEIESIRDLDVSNTAVISKDFADQVSGFSTDIENNSVELTAYKPHQLSYKVSSKANSLLIFSEVYYDKGWQAYIDGKPAEHFRANYVLRGISCPQGEHNIEFKFEPRTHMVAMNVALFSSILIGIVIVFMFVNMFKPIIDLKKLEEPEELAY